jgi:hypothetical protein
MRQFLPSGALRALLGTVLVLIAGLVSLAQESPLTVSNGGQSAHIFPSIPQRGALAALGGDAGPLGYHGGAVMTTAKSYAIFWVPAKLQNGAATTLSTHYRTVQKNLLTDYQAHSVSSNNTQYYQTVGNTTTYIKGLGGFAGTYVDTNPYPGSGCRDGVTGANCITDAQLQAEIQRVMTLKGWSGGLGSIFFVFTSNGEGSCFDAGGSSCAYTDYCAYHSYFTNASNQVVVYGNQPYADTNYCQIPGTPSPSNDAPADAAANVLSHELSEAITDPQLDAWYSAKGNEIGDLCAWIYGTNTWKSATANQMWNGHFYELQLEFDNHAGGCTQVGP